MSIVLNLFFFVIISYLAYYFYLIIVLVKKINYNWSIFRNFSPWELIDIKIAFFEIVIIIIGIFVYSSLGLLLLSSVDQLNSFFLSSIWILIILPLYIPFVLLLSTKKELRKTNSQNNSIPEFIELMLVKFQQLSKAILINQEKEHLVTLNAGVIYPSFRDIFRKKANGYLIIDSNFLDKIDNSLLPAIIGHEQGHIFHHHLRREIFYNSYFLIIFYIIAISPIIKFDFILGSIMLIFSLVSFMFLKFMSVYNYIINESEADIYSAMIRSKEDIFRVYDQLRDLTQTFNDDMRLISDLSLRLREMIVNHYFN